jgi:hypothetical protein
MSMLVVGATFVLAARLVRASGSVPRWIALTGWIVAIALILGVSIALLFPFGAWLIALGLTWKNDERTGRAGAGRQESEPPPGISATARRSPNGIDRARVRPTWVLLSIPEVPFRDSSPAVRVPGRAG